MEPVAETYRVKVHRDDSPSPSRPCRSAKKGKQSHPSSCIDHCPKPKSGRRGSCKRYKKDPSLDTLKKSVSANCCACCCVLGQYIKEVCKLLNSCLNEKPTETRICILFSQLLKLMWCLGTDCYYLTKYLLRFLCVYKK